MENNLPDEENSPSISFYLSEILKKYNLDEDPDKAFEKLDKGEQSNGEIIAKACKNLADNKVAEKDLINFLQKSFSTTGDTAQKIIDDIKNTILPLLKKNKKETEKKELASGMPVSEKPAYTVTQNITSEEPIGKATLPSKRIERMKKMNVPEDNKKTTPTQPKGPDSYREPIG